MIDDRTRARAWKNINEGILQQDQFKIDYGRHMLGGGQVVDDIIERFQVAPEKFLKANIKRLREQLA